MMLAFYTRETKHEITNVYVRFKPTQTCDLRVKIPIFVYSDCFKNGEIKIPKIASKAKINDCIEKQKLLGNLYNYLFEQLANVKSIEGKKLNEMICDFVLGQKETNDDKLIVDLYDTCLDERKVAFSTRKKLNVLKNLMLQFQEDTKTKLTTANFNEIVVRKILDVATNDESRGTNTAVTYYKSMRAFCRWLHEKNYLPENPFKGIEIPSERYGTPFYLTQEERDILATANLPTETGIQRDIFIFQCLIGCRVADLLQLTSNNINGDFVEYIADKTLKNPKVIKVPLCAKAKELIKKYQDPGRESLFPFISMQKYNEQIKRAAKLAGLNRQIPKYNTRTNRKEFAPLWQVISSHCARRTFIGILYKKTKDVNVIASMSGHVENSRAFTRYRAIDDDDKRELIDLL